jgi:excinuclease ABC subunit C
MFDSKVFLQTAPQSPGVYRMLDKMGKLLYVGKAKNLQKRLSSYFRTHDDMRIARMVKKIAKIELNLTSSEKEALLLENNLIKSLKPRYNILFRDDKSYPYLFLSKHLFPRLVYMRGKPKEAGSLFGPYTSVVAVRDALNMLQKNFMLRQCDDTFFNNRSRPCLQYQIKRCTAPCVQNISPDDYQKDVASVVSFLQGKQQHIIDDLIVEMEAASKAHDYEIAASLRNRISALRNVTSRQLAIKGSSNTDVIAAVWQHNIMAIHMLCIRNGAILDSHHFFSEQSGENEHDCAYALRSFILQFYLNEDNPRDFPAEINTNFSIEDDLDISELLSNQAKQKITLNVPKRGDKNKWLDMAKANAIQAIKQRATSASLMQKRWLSLKSTLGVAGEIKSMECFDISHSQGEATMASCVIFDESGPCKKEYRSYGLAVNTGDDYAAMKEVLFRRYSKRKSEGKPIADVIIIDGGKGQLNIALETLKECQILDVLVVGIAKGPSRKAGLETLFITKINEDKILECNLIPSDPALHLLQHIRDESHRFAVKSHKKRLSKSRKTSPLESIPGVGPKRRQELLRYFGGLQGLESASVDSIAKVSGISMQLAEKIYYSLREKR